MEIIALGRQWGKTTEMIRRCAAHQYALIVCSSRQEAQRVFARAKEMGLDIPMPITFDEFKGRRYLGRNIDAFYLDNADLFIQSLTHVPIAAISFSPEESEKYLCNESEVTKLSRNPSIPSRIVL